MTNATQIEKPTIFSKFHAYNTNLIQLLTCEQFYCANYLQLNDPYDCRIQFSDAYIRGMLDKSEKFVVDIDLFFEEFLMQIGANNKVRESLIDNIENKISLIEGWHQEYTDLLLKKLRQSIVSFTINQDLSDEDLLMWAHYTYSANGVKLKFDFGDPLSKMNIQKFMTKVTYQGVSEVKNLDELFKSIFNKAKGWNYENEYRIIRLDGTRQRFEKYSLIEMIFGYNMKNYDKEALIKLTKSLGYIKCKFYQMKFKKGKLHKWPIPISENGRFRI